MPRVQRGKTQGRQVGKAEKRKFKGLTQRQQVWLSALVIYCQQRETAVFLGTPTTTGSIRVNLYPPDDRCVGSLNFLDNFEEAVPELLSDVYEEEISAKDVARAVPWLARTVYDTPADEKPDLQSSETVEVPQRPAQKVSGA